MCNLCPGTPKSVPWMLGLCVARLWKSLTHVVSPYFGGVAECVLERNSKYVYAVCQISYWQLNVKKNTSHFLSCMFKRVTMSFRKYLGEIRCIIYGPWKPNGVPWVLGPSTHLGCEFFLFCIGRQQRQKGFINCLIVYLSSYAVT